jgi:hypothetical protein
MDTEMDTEMDTSEEVDNGNGDTGGEHGDKGGHGEAERPKATEKKQERDRMETQTIK